MLMHENHMRVRRTISQVTYNMVVLNLSILVRNLNFDPSDFDPKRIYEENDAVSQVAANESPITIFT